MCAIVYIIQVASNLFNLSGRFCFFQIHLHFQMIEINPAILIYQTEYWRAVYCNLIRQKDSKGCCNWTWAQKVYSFPNYHKLGPVLELVLHPCFVQASVHKAGIGHSNHSMCLQLGLNV